MSEIEKNLQLHRYEEGMRFAREMSERLGHKGLDPDLARAFAVFHGQVSGVIDGQVPSGQLEEDLKVLGFQPIQNLVVPEHIRLAQVSYEIVQIRTAFNQFLESMTELPSGKELEFLLQLDIPDVFVRMTLIQVLFSGKVFQRDLLNLVDVDELIRLGAKKPLFAGEKEDTRPDAKMYNLGRSYDEVSAQKAERGISSPLRGEHYDVSSIARNVRRRRSSVSGRSSESFADEAHRRAVFVEYVESTFAFCVSRLAQNAKNILWIQDTEKFSLEIPSDIRRRLDIVKYLCEKMGYFPFVEHLDAAVRAYMRVYLGTSNDDAPRKSREKGV